MTKGISKEKTSGGYGRPRPTGKGVCARNILNATAFYERMVNKGEPEKAIKQYVAGARPQKAGTADERLQAVEFLTRMTSDSPGKVDFKGVIAEGDCVVLHCSHESPRDEGGLVSLDIFWLDKQGKIVGHWDLLQPMPKDLPKDLVTKTSDERSRDEVKASGALR